MTTTIFATPALTVKTVHADAKHFGGQRLPPKYIVIHATGGTNSLGWLTTDSPLTNPVSVHRLIAKDGTITKIVNDDETAWHAGFGIVGSLGPSKVPNVNTLSLGIELENLNNGKDDYPAAQVLACAAQIVEWWGVYGFLPVLSHAAIDPRKNDPLGFSWQDLSIHVDSIYEAYKRQKWEADQAADASIANGTASKLLTTVAGELRSIADRLEV